MSAGSAFASGLRAGQAIWNSAVNNAMQKKRLDMAKTQFKYEQRQRKQAVENQIAAQDAFERFQSTIPTTDFDFKRQEDRDLYEKNMVEYYSDISRDPATLRQFEAFNKTMGIIGEADIANKIRANQANIGVTWDLYNHGQPRPQITDEKTGEKFDDYNTMDADNFDRAIKRKSREAQVKYGSIDDAIGSGIDPSDLPPELKMQFIRGRKQAWDKAMKSGDTDTIIKASEVFKTRPTSTEIQSIEKFKFTLDRLGELQDELEGEATGPILGIIRSANPYDEKAKLIKSQITKIIPGLARGVFGEVGVLTDPDVRMYSQTIGNLTTPEEVNKTLTAMAIDMVASGFENKLRTAAMSRANVASFYPQLEEIRAERNRLLGKEAEEATQDRPVVEVEEFRGKDQFSDEEKAEIISTGAKKVQILDKSTGKTHNINLERRTDSTTPPAPRPNTMDVLEELWPGSVNPPKEESKPAPSSDEIDKKLDKKLKIERRINVLQEQLDKLPSPPPSTRSRRSSYVPVYTNTKTDRDTEKKRKQLIESIKKNKENLSKL